MKVLVTGSSGFIGTHLLDHLYANGHEIAGLDRKPPRDSRHKPFFIPCDLLDKERLASVIRAFAPDAVCHLAARCSLNERAGLGHYAANTTGVEHLIEAIAQTSSIQRCLFTSTRYVCREGYTPAHATDFQPDTLYGRSKAIMEQIIRDRDGAGRVWCILRPTTVWGPGFSEHYASFLRFIEKRLFFHIGKHNPRKCLSYVGNVVVQYRSLLNAPAADVHRKVFYLADYEPVRLRDWARALQVALDAPPIPTVPEPAARLLARIGDTLNACGWKRFPFNSFRLRNILSDHEIDLAAIRSICPQLPFSLGEAAAATARWHNSGTKPESGG